MNGKEVFESLTWVHCRILLSRRNIREEVLMAERADPVFHNKVINGTAMKRLISRLIDHFGMAYTSHILDQVKRVSSKPLHHILN